MGRTGQQRLDAIPTAIALRNEFLTRVGSAVGDAVRLADLMAEAIDMLYEANGLETVAKDGRATVCIEKVMAAHCMFGARDAYRRARGSNLISAASPTAQPESQAAPTAGPPDRQSE